MKKSNIKCPYCGSPAQLRPASAIGKTGAGDSMKRFYVCARYPFCDSYVQAHRKSGLPMGSLANKELRRKRYEAHLALARLWQRGYMSKADAYCWLQTQMGILEADAHIGKFTEYRCDETIRLCDGFLRKAA